MKALPAEARTQNVTPAKEKRERCRYCLDNGYIHVETDRTQSYAYERYGPCPYCERGMYEEFPDTSARQRSEKNCVPIASPYGPDGFWKGRDLPHIEPLEQYDTIPLTTAAALIAIRALADRINRSIPE